MLSRWRGACILAVVYLCSQQCAASLQSERLRSAEIDTFDGSVLRADFTNAEEHAKTSYLLQEDGAVDTIKQFFLDLPDGVLADEIVFSQASTNEDVLSIKSDDNILVSAASSGTLNVTTTLVFDAMVGKTNYTLVALKVGTREVISTITLRFIIVGMTFYVEPSSGVKKIVSGSANAYSISYEAILNGTLEQSEQIRVFIQYPDGSSSDEREDTSIPFGQAGISSTNEATGQFNHDSALCDLTKYGTIAEVGLPQFPSGCGYGFFSDAATHLCFGIDFKPYRAGSASIQYLWPGFTSTSSELSEDAFEFVLNLDVTGSPPVVVTAVKPSEKIWRPEGGELISFTIINAASLNISLLQLRVDTVATPFPMVYQSFNAYGAPTFDQRFSCLTQPGVGSDLNWTLEFRVGTQDEIQTAVVLTELIYLFTYDTKSLSIDGLTPNFGEEEGGTEIRISGYFPSFDVTSDGVFFSGFRIPGRYIMSVSESNILFELPPKSLLGTSYEFSVFIGMGNAVSNSVLFSFIVKNAQVKISQTGTSEVDPSTYRVGNCTMASFTAVVSPFTNQVQSFQWTLMLDGTEIDKLQEAGLSSSNATAQTLILDPDGIAAGSYTLKVRVALLGKDIETDIHLLREYVITIGAFILDPPRRSIGHPDTPLRLSAVVRSPGECYTGDQGMMFEWSAFGKKQLYSATNATGSPILGNLTTTPARLGWEYVVPRTDLVHGNHTVTFKVWMAGDEAVFGQAEEQIVIQEAPLVPVIRSGEVQVSVNYLSTLRLYASKSYDPDVIDGDKTAALTYEWSCRQANSTEFTASTSTSCLSALLPDPTRADFEVAIAVLEPMTDVSFLKYDLVVKKGSSRISHQAELIVEIQNRGTNPFLTDFEISLTNGDGVVQDWDDVAHFDRSIVSISAAPDVSWTYVLLEPTAADFFSSSNLINNPLFFSPDANLFSVSGNTKPLGIEAGRLNAQSTYKLKILFDGSEQHEATSAVVSLTTAEAPTVGFSVPSEVNGTTSTVFTATAGVPQDGSTFSYYFLLDDKDGNTFCVGGCTGYDIAHFQIGREGSYTLTAFLFDMQGKALLDSKTLAQNITVSQTEAQTEYRALLGTLFEHGDDIAWTQLAHDLALMLLDSTSSSDTVRTLSSISGRQEAEDLLAERMQFALDISGGARKIFCSSYPNSYHGRDCVSLASELMKQSILDIETVYNAMVTVECCNENTPFRTVNKMGPLFPLLLGDLNRMARTIDQGGNSRRRLLQDAGAPANLLADVQSWSSRQMPASVASGQLDGYNSQYTIGGDNEYGQLSIVVASNPGHMPVESVNGEQRRVVKGPSGDELFYAKDACLSRAFSSQGDRKRIFVLYTLDNFVLEGFQDPPEGTNLADRLYWQRVFERSDDGRFVDVNMTKDDQCFCWRLPILRKKAFLEDSVDFMPGMFSMTNLKKFGVDVATKGEAFTYVYEGILTNEYNVSEGWVEACQDQVGMVSSTLVSKTSNNALGGGVEVLGTNAAALVGIVIGGLLFVVVAMASAWIFATRAMSDGAAPLGALAPHELYVERDVYGRGTIFDVNAVSLEAAE